MNPEELADKAERILKDAEPATGVVFSIAYSLVSIARSLRTIASRHV